MNFHLKHRGFELSETLRQEVQQKINRFNSILPESSYIELELIDHLQHHEGQKDAEVVVDMPGIKHSIRLIAHSPSFITAVDEVLDKLDDQLGQLREKSTDYHYKGKSPKEWLAEEMNQGED